MADNELSALRALARARLTAAARKQARLRRNNGVELRGTKYDVRPADPTVVNRLNRKQLESLIGRVDNFVSRRTQYVGGRSGEPIRGAAWQKYKKAESEYNKASQAQFGSLADVTLPKTSKDAKALTVREMEAMRQQKNIPRAGRSSTRPLAPVKRENARGITDEKSLLKIIKDMNKKLRPGYYKAALSTQKQAANKMLTTVGNDELLKKFERLTDEQFDIWWNFNPNTADNVSHNYFIAQAKLEGKERRDHATRESNLNDELNASLDWAKSLKTDEQAAAARASGSRLRNNNKRK